MLNISAIHHVAIICSDYQRSKQFYTDVLGFTVTAEHFRAERNSWKLDLALANKYQIELFSFPDPPTRPTHPEATGLRHLAFEVDALEPAIEWLQNHRVKTEPVRVDPFTGKRFTFFEDPDHLPLELYES
jgi:glyoxylase I family protein